MVAPFTPAKKGGITVQFLEYGRNLQPISPGGYAGGIEHRSRFSFGENPAAASLKLGAGSETARIFEFWVGLF